MIIPTADLAKAFKKFKSLTDKFAPVSGLYETPQTVKLYVVADTLMMGVAHENYRVTSEVCKLLEPADFVLYCETNPITELLPRIKDAVIDIQVADNNNHYRLTSSNGNYVSAAYQKDKSSPIELSKEATSFVLPAGFFNKYFDILLDYTGDDDLKPMTVAINVEVLDDQVVFVTTNLYTMLRMSLSTSINKQKYTHVAIPKSSLIAAKSLLLDIKTDITVLFDSTNIRFQAKDPLTIVVLNTTPYKLPNKEVIDNMFARDSKQKAKLNQSSLNTALSSIKGFATSIGATVELTASEDKLQIHAADLDTKHSAKVTSDIEIEEPSLLPFKMTYKAMQKVAKAISESSVEWMPGESRSMIVEDSNDTIHIEIVLMKTVVIQQQ